MRRLIQLARSFLPMVRSLVGAFLVVAVLTSPAYAFFNGGRIGKIHRHQGPVPELSPGAIGGGLAVLALGVLLLTDRRRVAPVPVQDGQR
jgi:hypothetical protein